ncbi:hypothetical protein D3C86_1913150 [compost metagenome]
MGVQELLARRHDVIEVILAGFAEDTVDAHIREHEVSRSIAHSAARLRRKGQKQVGGILPFGDEVAPGLRNIEIEQRN